MPKHWQKMKKNLVQLAFLNPFLHGFHAARHFQNPSFAGYSIPVITKHYYYIQIVTPSDSLSTVRHHQQLSEIVQYILITNDVYTV